MHNTPTAIEQALYGAKSIIADCDGKQPALEAVQDLASAIEHWFEENADAEQQTKLCPLAFDSSGYDVCNGKLCARWHEGTCAALSIAKALYVLAQGVDEYNGAFVTRPIGFCGAE